jgi:hypothetical protein
MAVRTYDKNQLSTYAGLLTEDSDLGGGGDTGTIYYVT